MSRERAGLALVIVIVAAVYAVAVFAARKLARIAQHAEGQR